MTKKPGEDDAKPDITAAEDGPNEITDEALDDAQGGFGNFLTIDARNTGRMNTLFAGAQDFATLSDFETVDNNLNTFDSSLGAKNFGKLKR